MPAIKPDRIYYNDLFRQAKAYDIRDDAIHYLNLKRNGSQLQGYCPSCNSSDAFTVPDKKPNFYKCFSCNISGSSIDFFLLLNREGIASRGTSPVEVAKSLVPHFLPFTLDKINPKREQTTPLPKIIKKKSPELEQKSQDKIKIANFIWSKGAENKEKILYWMTKKRDFPLELAEKAYEASKGELRYQKHKGDEQIIVRLSSGAIQRIFFESRDKPFLGSFSNQYLKLDTHSEEIIIVESVANALCLVGLGISAAIIFTTSNAKAVEKIIFENPSRKIFLWLDHGDREKELSEKLTKENPGLISVDFTTWPKVGQTGDFNFLVPNGYDINDLLRDHPARFAEIVLARLKRCETAFRAIYGNDNHPDLEKAFEEALQSKKPHWLIESPTGSGKSTASRKWAIAHLRQGANTLFVANQKSDMFQWADNLRKELTDQEEPRIIELCRETAGQLPVVENGKTENPFIIVTHHTYLTRKGHGLFHYAPLLWPGKVDNLLVIVDEFKSYLAAQAFSIELGTRYSKARSKSSKVGYTEKVVKCYVKSKRGSCSTCKSCHDAFLYADRYGISKILPYIPGKTGADYEQKNLSCFIKKERYARWNTNEAWQVDNPEYEKHLSRRKYEVSLPDGEKPPDNEEEEIIHDLVYSSYQAEVTSRTAIDKKKNTPVNPEKIIEALKHDPKATKKYTFPTYSCEVETLNVWDRSSLSYIAHNSKKLIMLCSDTSEVEKDFIESCCPQFETRKIIKSKQRIKNLLVIFFNQELSLVSEGKRNKFKLIELTERLDKDENMLIFTPTQSQAKSLFVKFPNHSGETVGMISSKSKMLDYRGKIENTRMWITHSLGSQGKAVDRPKDMITIIDALSPKPANALRRKKGETLTEESIKRAMVEDVTETVIQNQGRMLRENRDNPDKPKLLIIHNCELLDKKKALGKLRMCVDNLLTLEVKHRQDFLQEEAKFFIDNGHLSGRKEPEGSQSQSLVEKLTEKALEKSKEGKSVREIERELNFRRYKKDKKLSKKDIDSILKKIEKERSAKNGMGFP